MGRRKHTSRPRGERVHQNPLEYLYGYYDLAPNDSGPVVFGPGSHLDHGLLDEHWEFVQELARHHIAENGLSPLIKTFEMPAYMTPLPSGLYGPAAGDEPVPEEAVFYARRGPRGWPDRLIIAPKRLSSLITVVAVPETRDKAPTGRLVVWTAYGGPMAPQNPADPGNANPAAATAFWSEHALAVDEVPAT